MKYLEPAIHTARGFIVKSGKLESIQNKEAEGWYKSQCTLLHLALKIKFYNHFLEWSEKKKLNFHPSDLLCLQWCATDLQSIKGNNANHCSDIDKHCY